jgi:hypothetical protein
MTKNWKKLYFFDQKLQFTYPEASIKDVQARVQEKPSALNREHRALQNMNFHHFFLFLWVIFALKDPLT